MGFRTVAIARGKDKETLVKKLGATQYLDSLTTDTTAELGKLGGAKAIVATVSSGKAMSAAIAGLGLNGRLLVVGVTGEPIDAQSFLLITGRLSLEGVYSGVAIDSEDALAFSVLQNVRSMSEVYPFEQAAKAYARMLSGDARFRVVLDLRG
jgi:propanol-preferring alcohol dehydrogenase